MQVLSLAQLHNPRAVSDQEHTSGILFSGKRNSAVSQLKGCNLSDAISRM
jgi:hypothetical protein